MDERRSRRALLTGAAALAGGLAGCGALSGGSGGSTGGSGDWTTTELTDVRTGETFTVAGFDRPVLVETFAVWCPVCTRQQRQVAALHEQVGDEVVSVSINIDVTEGGDAVEDHLDEHGFDWRFAVPPAEVIGAIEDQFGVTATSAPSAPVIRVCPDGEATLLGTGYVKSVDELLSAAREC